MGIHRVTMPTTTPTAGTGFARAERFAVAELDDVDETWAGRGWDDEHAELRCLCDGYGEEGHVIILPGNRWISQHTSCYDPPMNPSLLILADVPRPKPDEDMVMRSVRIPQSLADAVHAAAGNERRSDNNMLTVLIEEALTARAGSKLGDDKKSGRK